MAVRPSFNVSQISSTTAAVSGAEMSDGFAATAFPEGQSKRQSMDMRTLDPNGTELFIDGQNLYRFQAASDSSFIIRGTVAYFTGVAANCCAFDVTVAGRCVAGVITLNAAATVTKIGASAAAFAVAVINSNQLAFNCTPVGGDTNQRWEGRFRITEITDIG